MNYAVITGVVVKTSGLFETRTGLPVLHLLVEHAHGSDYQDSKPQVFEIRVDIWGKAARALDEKLKPGTGILAEGILASREKEDYAGVIRKQNVLRARRVEIIHKER